MAAAPYRLQVFLTDELRDVLRDIAHRERISQQKLVVQWLTEKAKSYLEGASLPDPEDEQP